MIKEFNRICLFRQSNPGIAGKGLNIKDPLLDEVKNDLRILKEFMEDNFGKYRDIDFSVEVSQGQGFFPSVLHVCILPPNQKVSSGIYVGICFDILGRGALIGCMESVTHSKGLNTVIRKKNRTKLTIDVDGGRLTTKYNNSYGNPKEFYIGLEDDSELLNHIKLSLDISLYHLKLSDSLDLNIDSMVVSHVNNFEFNPTDLMDGKKRIVREIVARRGQKKFRDSLMLAYDHKCAITKDNVEQVLEAAHILPYNGEKTNHIQNGILLRSDIHLLFDLGLITINAEDYIIKVHSSLNNSPYFIYNNIKANIPNISHQRPNKEVLNIHNKKIFSK